MSLAVTRVHPPCLPRARQCAFTHLITRFIPLVRDADMWQRLYGEELSSRVQVCGLSSYSRLDLNGDGIINTNDMFYSLAIQSGLSAFVTDVDIVRVGDEGCGASIRITAANKDGGPVDPSRVACKVWCALKANALRSGWGVAARASF